MKKGLVLFVAVLFLSINAYAAGEIYLEKSAVRHNAGNILLLQVKVKDVGNLYGAAFDVKYNPQQLTFEGISAGAFLKSKGVRVAIMKRNVPSSKKIIVGISRLGKVSGKSGNGVLADLKFSVKSGGKASLSLSNVSLRDPNLNKIAVTSRSISFSARTLSSVFNVLAYPNPARRSVADISFKITGLISTDAVKIIIYDISGRRIKDITGTVLQPPKWNLNGVSNGVYLYRATAGGKIKTGKIAVLR